MRREQLAASGAGLRRAARAATSTQDSAAISRRATVAVRAHAPSAAPPCRLPCSASSRASQSQLLGAAQVRLGGLGQAEEVARRAPAAVVLARRLGQPLGAERPDRLQHPVAAAAASTSDLSDQAGQQRPRRRAAPHTALDRRRACAPPANTASRLASACSSLVEQVPAPLHDRAQRPVPGAGGAVAARQQPEPVVRAGRRSPRRSACRSRAAASSIASGSPSSARQIRCTASQRCRRRSRSRAVRRRPGRRTAAPPDRRRVAASAAGRAAAAPGTASRR